MVVGSGAIAAGGIPVFSQAEDRERKAGPGKEILADVVIAGGGMGGCAAALAALRNGLRVVMTEETRWIGGQLTQQGLSCPDEHQWIEQFGSTRSYRDLRTAIRTYYKRHYPLTQDARSRKNLNPGNGSVSRLCHEPRVSLAVLYAFFLPYLSAGKMTLLLQHRVRDAEVEDGVVRSVEVEGPAGDKTVLLAPFFLDATELGDLLPLTDTAFVTGAESQEETGELHAPEEADPDNQQAFTHCMAMDYVPGENFVGDPPKGYSFWKKYLPELTPPWSGKLLSLSYSNPQTLAPKTLGFDPTGAPTGNSLNLWNYRKIIDPGNFTSGFYTGGMTIVNWPQNDFLLGNLVGVSPHQYEKNLQKAEELSLSLFYWLQTEVPRPDGGMGWPGLRLRGDVMGTDTGLAQYPYVRESRRIKAVFTVLEEHVGAQNRLMVAGQQAGKNAASFFDSVGIGYYHIDLHPSSSGVNYVDFGSLPFQIPLGALLPQETKNVLPACKNIGTTHITNGCYREHPVEWNIGEAAGLLAAFAFTKRIPPHAVRENKTVLKEFQAWIQQQGVALQWPDSIKKA